MEWFKWFIEAIGQSPLWVKWIVGSGATVLLIGIVLVFVARPSPVKLAVDPTPVRVAADPTDVPIWFTMGPVEVFGRDQQDDPAIKVEADINGTKYVYPSLSGVKWLKIGPAMAPETFAIPASARYEIRIVATLSVKGTTKKLASQEVVRVSDKQATNFTGKYVLFPVDERGRRGASVVTRVNFSLSSHSS